MAELVFFSGTMDCGKSTLALQMDYNHRARGRGGVPPVLPVLPALLGHVETLVVVHAHDPIVVAACLLQAPALLRVVVPTPLDNVRPVVISAALNSKRPAAVPADDGDFVGAEVYDIPVLIGLIGVAPLLDVSPILHALLGNVQGFITMPVHDRA